MPQPYYSNPRIVITVEGDKRVMSLDNSEVGFIDRNWPRMDAWQAVAYSTLADGSLHCVTVYEGKSFGAAAQALADHVEAKYPTN